jgi:hypothetical protein
MQEARRYALSAAAFHPYGYVLENCKGQIQISSRRDVNQDVDDILAGRPPFQVVQQVFERLTEGTSSTSTELIRRNLSRVVSERYRE